MNLFCKILCTCVLHIKEVNNSFILRPCSNPPIETFQTPLYCFGCSQDRRSYLFILRIMPANILSKNHYTFLCNDFSEGEVPVYFRSYLGMCVSCHLVHIHVHMYILVRHWSSGIEKLDLHISSLCIGASLKFDYILYRGPFI